MINKVLNELEKYKTIEEKVLCLYQYGAMTEKSMRRFLVNREYNHLWSTTNANRNEILCDLSVKYDMTVSGIRAIIE